jgi:hypothetical protein
VPLEDSFAALSTSLLVLRDTARTSQVAVAEDRPEGKVSKFVDDLADALDDMLGELEGALATATVGNEAVGNPPNLDVARRALANTHRAVLDAGEVLASRLLGFESVTGLLTLARDRRSGRTRWLAWVRVARVGLEDCRAQLAETDRALLLCWRDIAERAALMNLSVRAIGQLAADPATIAAPGSEGLP